MKGRMLDGLLSFSFLPWDTNFGWRANACATPRSYCLILPLTEVMHKLAWLHSLPVQSLSVDCQGGSHGGRNSPSVCICLQAQNVQKEWPRLTSSHPLQGQSYVVLSQGLLSIHPPHSMVNVWKGSVSLSLSLLPPPFTYFKMPIFFSGNLSGELISCVWCFFVKHVVTFPSLGQPSCCCRLLISSRLPFCEASPSSAVQPYPLQRDM